MARIASRCMALVLLTTWITSCVAVPEKPTKECIEKLYYIEKVEYDVSEKHLLNNIFGTSIEERQSTYIKRRACCDGENKPDHCGIPFCNNLKSVRCSESVGKCSLSSTVCRLIQDAISEKNKREPHEQYLPSFEPTLKGVPDDLLPGGEVNVNHRSVVLPFQTSSGITINPEGVYKRPECFFDGNNNAVIEVNSLHESSAEWNDKFGLCGNYDLDPRNDLHNRSVKSFVNELNLDQGIACRKVNEALLNPFDSLDMPNKEKVRKACDDFASQPFFKDCRSLSDVKPFIDSCYFILSRALIEKSSFEQGQCDVYAEYSMSCSRIGLHVDWRPKLPNGTCAVSCDHGMVYKECGSACPPTCENFNPEDCGNACVPGCQCTSGTYFDGEMCVTKENCPCFQAGEFYPDGSVMKVSCDDCVCVEGKLQDCSNNPCPVTCTIFGGHYFNTFEGKSYEFDGNCEYVLVQNGTESGPPFSIFMDKSECGELEPRCWNVPKLSIKTPDGSLHE
ncbi:von Willebrand factor-like [Acanthaster planci]|uniref:von Willebrand factor-like n=1 Tax=Acanthaster planci TaxID=133434 RepID=A0A8B7ZT39_ACAPL|nr:von Willebrand factor-like [Acanthaster planci]